MQETEPILPGTRAFTTTVPHDIRPSSSQLALVTHRRVELGRGFEDLIMAMLEQPGGLDAASDTPLAGLENYIVTFRDPAPYSTMLQPGQATMINAIPTPKARELAKTIAGVMAREAVPLATA